MSDPLGNALREDLRRHRELLAGRVPAFEALYRPLIARTDDVRFAAAWAHRSFSAFYDRPLLIFASLRERALRDPHHPLAALLADQPAADTAERVDDAGLEIAMEDAGFWDNLGARHVQTNETGRAVVWLWPASALGLRAYTLVDLGSSAGLNLVADRLEHPWRDEDDQPLFDEVSPPTRRVGLDLRPLDPHAEADRRWLRACVWPGEHARLQRLNDAFGAMESESTEQVALDLADAPAWLDEIAGPVLAYQSIVRDYLPERERKRYEAAMSRWASERAGRVWAELEYVEGGAPCGIVVHDVAGSRLWGTCSYHPTVVRRTEGAPCVGR